MSELSEGARKVLQIALKQNDDSFLFLQSDNSAREVCRELVNSGLAEWIPSNSNFAPGIQLTPRAKY